MSARVGVMVGVGRKKVQGRGLCSRVMKFWTKSRPSTYEGGGRGGRIKGRMDRAYIMVRTRVRTRVSSVSGLEDLVSQLGLGSG